MKQFQILSDSEVDRLLQPRRDLDAFSFVNRVELKIFSDGNGSYEIPTIRQKRGSDTDNRISRQRSYSRRWGPGGCAASKVAEEEQIPFGHSCHARHEGRKLQESR